MVFFMFKEFSEWVSEWVSEWLLLFRHCSAISWREQVNYQWDDDEVRLLDQHTELDFYSANNSPCVDMSLHTDTLFWFQANQSLLFLLNTACLAEK
jgi:hypothetical protein